MQYNQSADFAKIWTVDIQKIKKVPRPHEINKTGVSVLRALSRHDLGLRFACTRQFHVQEMTS